MIISLEIPKKYWGEVVHAAVYIKNYVLTIKSSKKMLEKRWLGKRLSVRHIRTFRCVAYAYINGEKRKNKLDIAIKKGIFVGY